MDILRGFQVVNNYLLIFIGDGVCHKVGIDFAAFDISCGTIPLDAYLAFVFGFVGSYIYGRCGLFHADICVGIRLRAAAVLVIGDRIEAILA